MRDNGRDNPRKEPSESPPADPWPPIPPTVKTHAPRSGGKGTLQAFPIWSMVVLSGLIGAYSHNVDPCFMVDPVLYDEGQRVFVALGVTLMIGLWLKAFRSIPWLFRLNMSFRTPQDSLARHYFVISAIVILCMLVMNVSRFPKALLEQLHEQSTYRVFQQDAQIIGKSYREDDDAYQFTLQTVDGERVQLKTNQAVYDQAMIGSILHLSGSETRYGKLVINQSVVTSRVTPMTHAAPSALRGGNLR